MTKWNKTFLLQCSKHGKHGCFDIAVGIGISSRNCACKQSAWHRMRRSMQNSGLQQPLLHDTANSEDSFSVVSVQPAPWSTWWLGWRMLEVNFARDDRTLLFSTDSTSSFFVADKGGSSTAALPETDRHKFARRSSGGCWRSSTQLFSSWCHGWMAWGTLANTQVSMYLEHTQ